MLAPALVAAPDSAAGRVLLVHSDLDHSALVGEVLAHLAPTNLANSEDWDTPAEDHPR